MPTYYVNKNAQSISKDHEVHIITCSHPAYIKNRELLGAFSDCHDAVKEAKKRGYKANGCKFCSPACHTT